MFLPVEQYTRRGLDCGTPGNTRLLFSLWRFSIPAGGSWSRVPRRRFSRCRDSGCGIPPCSDGPSSDGCGVYTARWHGPTALLIRWLESTGPDTSPIRFRPGKSSVCCGSLPSAICWRSTSLCISDCRECAGWSGH